MSIKLPARCEPVPLERIRAICEHYGLKELWAQIEADPPPKPFVSDGCSGFPNAWIDGRDLYEGCFIHDLCYWAGRPGDDLGRLKADVWLMLWVAEHVDVHLGVLMFGGVRAGGSEKLPTPWRWGYGWEDWPHGYDSLDHSPTVNQLLEDLNIKQVILEQLQK